MFLLLFKDISRDTDIQFSEGIYMFHRRTMILNLLSISLLSTPLISHANEPLPTRAILLNAVYGTETQPVKLLVIQGEAKGCVIEGTASYNKSRFCHEYDLGTIHCEKDGHNIPVGNVVRGQLNITGTLANSGMGRDYLITNKGVTVTLANE